MGHLVEVIGPQLGASEFIDQRWSYINGVPIRPILYPPIPRWPVWPVFLRPSIVRFLLTEEGNYVRLSSVSPGREVLNTP